MASPTHSKKHVEAWQASELSQVAYCPSGGLECQEPFTLVTGIPPSAGKRNTPVDTY
jgi:hypothetical protein